MNQCLQAVSMQIYNRLPSVSLTSIPVFVQYCLHLVWEVLFAYLPIVRPQVDSSKINVFGSMVSCEILPSYGCPAIARVQPLVHAAQCIKSLFAYCNHVIWILAFEMRAHLLYPAL